MLVLISLWVIYDGVKKDMILEVEIIYVQIVKFVDIKQVVKQIYSDIV